MMRRRRRPEQRELPFVRRGGRREGAGRKPKGKRPGVAHGPRAPLARRFPLHVTLRFHRGLPALRRRSEYAALRASLAKRCEQSAFRVVHDSVQNDHIHLLVEGSDRPSVSVALQGLLTSIAKRLNGLWRRKGAVFADRYHDRPLRTPREVRNALVYVLNNARKHGSGQQTIDPFTSGPWFDGWRAEIRILGIEGVERPVGRSRTWLLGVGWRRHGLVGWDEIPRSA
jgi:REP element-mobilizing transposase RayT